MLLGDFSAWAQSQLVVLGGKEIEEALVEVTCKNKLQCGLLPYLLGSCFKLRLLHAALPELHCSCIAAMPMLGPDSDLSTCLPSLTSALPQSHGGA